MTKRTLQEQRQEGNHEHQEDADNRAVDPLEDGGKVVATRWPDERTRRGVLANRNLRVQRTQEHHYNNRKP